MLGNLLPSSSPKSILEQILPIAKFIPISLIILATSLTFILCILFCRILLHRIKTFTPTEILCGKDILSPFLIPLESNEIALTTILLKQYRLNVGDTTNFQLVGENSPRQFKISGSFQAMYNMGELILLNPKFNSENASIN